MKSSRSFAPALAQFWFPLLILLVFGVYHGCITFVNHAQFRTYAFDLGYYDHTVYELGHLRLGEHVLENSTYWHTWGDHFEPSLILIGPLVHIFGNATLLIVQWAALLIGAIGAFRYFQFRSTDPWLPTIAMAQFLAIWGNSSALSFDFHASVLGSMAVPWILLYFAKAQWGRCATILVFMLGFGEKLAFWGVFIFAGLAILHLRDRRRLWWALSAATFCMAWTFIAINWIAPFFLKPGQEYRHMNFHVWGDTGAQSIAAILTHPGKALRLLYESHIPSDRSAWMLKVELWKMIALSGGIALLRRPQYLLMLAPILLTKLYNDDPARWGINLHYSIEFVPILCIACYEWVKDIRRMAWRRFAAIFILALTLTASIGSLFTRYKGYWCPENGNVFDPAHWKRKEYDICNLHHALSFVPDHVPVAASDRIVPHVPLRDKIYFFPSVADAEYAIVQLTFDTYPMSEGDCRKHYNLLIQNREWEEVWRSPEVGVLRRLPSPMP